MKLKILIFVVGILVGAYLHTNFEIVKKTSQFSTEFLPTDKYAGQFEQLPTNNSIASSRSTDYKSMAQQAAQQHGISVNLLYAIIRQESAWNPSAVSSVGALGLMQIMPGTGKSFCDLNTTELLDPQKNLNCGVRYFKKQLKRFGTVKLALCAYNAGPHRVASLGRCPNFKETNKYTRNILANWNSH